MPAWWVTGEALDVLRAMPDDSVDLVLTSRRRMVADMPKSASMDDRWAEKVDQRGSDECWPWLASHDADGYGRFQEPTPTGQRHIRAHRWTYERWVGPIPDGSVVMHTCDNPPCVNPAHLRLGTPRDNNADKVAKGRHAQLWGTPLTRSCQTECWRGHPLSGDNLYITPAGHRRCRACSTINARIAYRLRHGLPLRPDRGEVVRSEVGST